jgi:hypothetical protein
VESVRSTHVAFPDKEREDLQRSLPVGELDPCRATRSPLYRRCVLLVSRQHRSPPPDTLWSPRSESQGMLRTLRRLPPPFGIGLITVLIRRLSTRERRGTSSVRFAHRFLQVTPPSTRHVLCGESPTPQRAVGPQRPYPQRFRRVRTLAPMPGRIVMPPEVSPPGHFIAALTGRPWLRTPPAGEFER